MFCFEFALIPIPQMIVVQTAQIYGKQLNREKKISTSTDNQIGKRVNKIDW